MVSSLLLLFLSIFLIVKSADFAITYSSKLAQSLGMSKYVLGFLVVAVISILPETFISVTSAVDGIPAFGLGTLFGSNVADLTLVFAIVLFASQKDFKIQSKLIKSSYLYYGILSVPIILGLNGYYSRLEGLALVVLGSFFYVYVLKSNRLQHDAPKQKFSPKHLLLLLASMAGLLLGAKLVVNYGVDLANILNINPIFVAMFVVGLGTTLPEMIFSLKAAKKHKDELALGDILGTVVADATVVVGIIALIQPFAFNPRIVYITGVFMLLALFLLFHFMKTGRILTKREGFLLLLFYTVFVLTELLTSGL